MDLLGDVLLNTRLLASSICILDLGGDWGLEFPGDRSNFALGMGLLEGPCWFSSDTMGATKLHPGDSLLVPRGAPHVLSAHRGAPTVSFSDYLHRQGVDHIGVGYQTGSPPVMRWGEGPVRTRILGYGLIAQDAGSRSILSNLPPAVIVRNGGTGLPAWLQASAAMLEGENRANPGYVATATKLVELILTSIVREHARTNSTIDVGWMTGVRDVGVGRALACIHGQPGVSWTVNRLAHEARMSRSTFVRRFTELLGETPISYLINHRMHLAHAQLSIDRRSVADVSEALGYRSERAFRHAFKTRFGVSPSRYAHINADEDEPALVRQRTS